jgi:hypothetical protein
MPFLGLPNELILEIACHLSTEKDISNLNQTNRRLYGVLNRFLYRWNLQHCSPLKQSAVEFTIRNGHEAVFVNLLLDQGADPNGYYCRVPMYSYAASHGQVEIMKILRERGAILNAHTVTLAMELMGTYDHPRAIEFILSEYERGNLQVPYPDDAKHYGYELISSTLANAICYERVEIAKLVLERFDPNLKCPVRGVGLPRFCTCLSYSSLLETAINNRQVEVVEGLLEKGVHHHIIRLDDSLNGEMMLSEAAKSQDGGTVGPPIEKSIWADIGVCETVSRAACRGDEAILKLLVNHGCPIWPRMFWTAATKGQVAVVEFLLGRINAAQFFDPTSEGYSDSMLRVLMSGHTAVARLLVGHGAQLEPLVTAPCCWTFTRAVLEREMQSFLKELGYRLSRGRQELDNMPRKIRLCRSNKS